MKRLNFYTISFLKLNLNSFIILFFATYHFSFGSFVVNESYNVIPLWQLSGDITIQK